MKVYIDLDGVCVQHDELLCKLLNLESYKDAKKDDVAKLQLSHRFFLNLPKTSIADELIKTVVRWFGSYNILTSPNHGCWFESAIDKLAWIKDELLIMPTDIIFSREKFNYAKGNLLIDDYGPNVKQWREHGGYAVKFKANSKNYTLEEKLEEIKSYANIIRTN
jgi:5'(3')-deoxyribonucleotidase